MFRKRSVFMVILVALMTLTGTLHAQPTVTLGINPDAVLEAAVRYRTFNNGNQGVRIAAPVNFDNFSGVEGSVSGGWGAGRCIQITYDGVSTLQTKVAALASPCSFTTTVASVTKPGLALGTLNYLQIDITKNTNTTTVALNAVLLTPPGAPTGNLGNFSLASPTAGPLSWGVTGVDLSSGFTLVGTLAITGLNGGGDSNFVQINVGEVPPADNEGPVTSNVAVTPRPVLLNGEATVKALVDDSTTGNNTISSASYSVDGGSYSPMDAKDGGFDEVSEYVQATFTTTEVGTHDICVYGTDSLNNAGDPTCQYFLVTYKFDGFYSPVDNNYVNVAKAGQAIPIKWRLTDANDVPISDPASFVNVYSSVYACTGGDPTDSVEEYASGSSGLQYVGDGYWQFTWKTPKNYANSCRGMYVEFDSGATSPVVKFQFK